MKTYNGFWTKIISVDNINAAIDDAARGKKHLRSVKRALAHKEETAKFVSNILSKHLWRPSLFHHVRTINDGIQMKKREIICPEFVREQVVHHAVMRVIEPAILRRFHPYSCGSVPGRGDKLAVDYLRNKIKSSKRKLYVAKLDVKKFFDSAKPSLVFKILRKMIRDKNTLLLLSQILRGNTVRREDGSYYKKGLPIGFYTSPWFANILLTPLDHHISSQYPVTYVRFIDDVVIMGTNKRKVWEACEEFERYLNTECKLQLKYEAQVHRLDRHPFEFIGFCFSESKVYLRSPCFLRAIRSIRRMSQKKQLTTYDCAKAVCYAGRFKRCDTRMAFDKYIKPFVNIRKCRMKISWKARKRNYDCMAESGEQRKTVDC